MRFTRDMSIFEALAVDPAVRVVFESHGMACCLCIGAQSETNESGAILHQVDPQTVVSELNRLCAGERRRDEEGTCPADLRILSPTRE